MPTVSLGFTDMVRYVGHDIRPDLGESVWDALRATADCPWMRGQRERATWTVVQAVNSLRTQDAQIVCRLLAAFGDGLVSFSVREFRRGRADRPLEVLARPESRPEPPLQSHTFEVETILKIEMTGEFTNEITVPATVRPKKAPTLPPLKPFRRLITNK